MAKQTEHRVLQISYVVVLVGLGLILISPFLIPLVFAGTVSLALFPLQQKMEEKGVHRKISAGLLTLIFTIVISIPFGFFITKGTVEVTRQLEKLAIKQKIHGQGVTKLVGSLQGRIVDYIQVQAVKYDLADFLTLDRINKYLLKINAILLNFFQDFASSLPTLFLLFLIMIVCIYSFLKNAEGVRGFFENLFGFTEERMDELVYIFKKNSRQVYISNIVTGGVQSLIVASGVALLGLGDFFLVFFVTLILSFIPVIGAAPVAFLFSLYAFLGDNVSAAVILLVLGSFTGIVDNFLRPWLASFGESKIPPIAAFVCVIGGALLFGFPGLFIGLLIGTIAYDTLPLFWNELKKVPEKTPPEQAPLILTRPGDESGQHHH
jgi:predicted PurR-regulated permease PerM